jgi:hypothetical protein
MLGMGASGMNAICTVGRWWVGRRRFMCLCPAGCGTILVCAVCTYCSGGMSVLLGK